MRLWANYGPPGRYKIDEVILYQLFFVNITVPSKFSTFWPETFFEIFKNLKPYFPLVKMRLVFYSSYFFISRLNRSQPTWMDWMDSYSLKLL